MKRPFLLVAGAAVAGLLIAGIGASAHTFMPAGFTGVHTATFGDEATGARTESPEPTESPEARPTSEPAEAPKPPSATEPAEPPETDEQGDDSNEQGPPEQPKGSGEHDGGGGDAGD